MARTIDATTPVRLALKRLRESDTPLKRKNARKILRRAIKDVWREADAAYPSLRPDGTPIIPRKSRGAYCPKCNTPMRTWAILVDHMARHHVKLVSIQRLDPLMGPTFRCSCGFTGKRGSMARHLSGQKDLVVHLCSVILTKAYASRIDFVDTTLAAMGRVLRALEWADTDDRLTNAEMADILQEAINGR